MQDIIRIRRKKWNPTQKYVIVNDITKCFEHIKSLQLKKVYASIDAFINMNRRHAGIVFLIAIDIVKPIVSTITYLLL